MFAVERLLRGCLSAVEAEDPDAAVEAALQGVVRRQIKVPGQVAIQYPPDVAALEPVRAAMTTPAAGAAVVGDALLRPARVYPLSDGAAVEGVRERNVALVLPWRVAGELFTSIIEVSATHTDKKFAAPLSWSIEARVVPESGLVEGLEQMYVRSVAAARVVIADQGRVPTLLWLGGSSNNAELPVDWRIRIAAVGAVRGYAAEVIEDPIRRVDQARSRIHDVRPAVLVVWCAAGGAAETYTDNNDFGGRAIPLTEGTLEGALLELRLELEDLAVNPPPDNDPPGDWAAFEEALDTIRSNAFVVTDAAVVAMWASGYGNPTRMWEHVEALARLAESYRGREGNIGERFAEWAHAEFGIEVALHDDNLGDLADFEHEGRAYRSEPHIKVDDAKAWIDVGRVYFAIDHDGLRLIVQHIGGKLY